MIAMYQEGVIGLVKDNFHDGLHQLFGNANFLCSRHVDNLVSNAIFLDKVIESRGKVVLDKRPVGISRQSFSND